MVVSQPDRIHTIVDRKVLNWKDYVKFTIKCRKCAISNILYWSKPKDNWGSNYIFIWKDIVDVSNTISYIFASSYPIIFPQDGLSLIMTPFLS